mmetsp:Transcript_99283/g.269828  ORF Transcript_99283/g.269828 Transcript_99283/m.269828 type:complete len:281 (-) Transcript_99283:653-1495(-)
MDRTNDARQALLSCARSRKTRRAFQTSSMRSTTRIMPLMIGGGAESDERAAQRLSISSSWRSCGAWPTVCSRTLATLTAKPTGPGKPGSPLGPARLPRRPARRPGVQHRAHESKTSWKSMTSKPPTCASSSSIDQTGNGHCVTGRRLRQSRTMLVRALINRSGGLPPSRRAISLKPRCRYSMASESMWLNTGGRDAGCSSAPPSARAATSSSTAARSSSSALSTTEASRSITSGRTPRAHSSQTCRSGQVRSSSARLPRAALRTDTDSSAAMLSSAVSWK